MCTLARHRTSAWARRGAGSDLRFTPHLIVFLGRYASMEHVVVLVSIAHGRVGDLHIQLTHTPANGGSPVTSDLAMVRGSRLGAAKQHTKLSLWSSCPHLTPTCPAPRGRAGVRARGRGFPFPSCPDHPV